MSKVTAPTEKFSMQTGHTLLQEGSPYEALEHFLHFAELDPMTDQSIPGAQMAGIAYRQLGCYEESVKILRKARDLMDDSADLRLKATVLRDLGAALQEAWLQTRRLQFLDEARKCFDESYNVLAFAIKRSGHAYNPEYSRLKAELATTTGFRGMLMFYNGARDNGKADIQLANMQLKEAGDEFKVYRFNNLIRLMRVSNFRERRKLFKEALSLTKVDPSSEYPDPAGLPKRVWAAMLGNWAYTELTKH